MTGLVVDLFAGAGGWDEGMLALDLDANVVGIEWDEWACRTGKAAGHARVRADVSVLHPAFFPMVGLIASAPCTKFSAAGSGVGRKVLAVLTAAVRSLLHGRDARAEVIAAIYPVCLKDRRDANNKRAEGKRLTTDQVERSAREDAACTALVLEPARWLHAGNPEWVAFEQVPDVLPIWREYVRVLKEMGWSAWCGVLNAADFGVPQTRERAILIASRVRAVAPPEPTHAEYAQGEDLFGGQGPTQWLSMAAALGWNDDAIVNTRGDRKTPGGNEFSASRPSWALTEKTRSWTASSPSRRFVSAGVTGEGRPKDPAVQPAPNVNFGARSNKVEWIPEPIAGDPKASGVRVTVQEAAVLQSFPWDYPWQGSKSRQFLQVGNAVCPLLAAHVVAAASGAGFRREVAA